tara:strand:+ start:101 stop:1060 length:960 start_codon:yes stop_codon:yes gene_type:complete
MKKLDLTFENWWNGDIELTETYKYFDSIKKNLDVIQFSILSFPDNEAEKIKLKQEELFKLYVTDLTNLWIQDFNKRFTNAPSPLDMLHLEANRIAGVIRGGHTKQGTDFIYFHYANLVIPKDAIPSFQNYLNNRLEEREIKTISVPSPNSLFYDKKNLIPEVYVESLINVYLHLGKFDSSIQLKKLFKAPFKMIYGDEPKNPYPKIFTSGWGYRAFLWAEELVTQDNTKNPGDYALILQVLKHENVEAIFSTITHEKFIDFISVARNVKFKVKSFRAAKPKWKKNSLKFVLRRYLIQLEIIDRKDIEDYIQRVIDQKPA